MNLVEFWKGTREELQVIKKASSEGRKLTKKEEENRRKAAFATQRRILLRRILAVGGATVAGSTGIAVNTFIRAADQEALTVDVNKEAAYQSYVDSFASVAKGDQEAEEILKFFLERKKRGKLSGRNILADEPGTTGTNFYTVIVDPVKDRQAFAEMPGVAEFKQNVSPSFLLLKSIPISSVWKGVLLGHEAYHVYQWLNNIEQKRQDGFLKGEQEAYEMEFRLLDRASKGRFRQVLRQQAPLVRQDSYRGRLSSDDERLFHSVFPPVLSEEEMSFRIPAYLIALNFSVAEMRSSSGSQATENKLKYIRSIFQGNIPLLR